MSLAVVGVALAALAFAAGAGGPGRLAAGVALATGGSFLLLQTVSRQASGEPAVRVGGPILPFRAPDAEGEAFDLATLAGKPFLLKFFRGHW